ncbi:hypothetical protein BHAOGJBA_1347 [Methylobacterium hispanicum]|uniref:Uncharacterized protein n=1 Tax=Methylobacterium hispanicum TaxID=270350 RepID=A0AAV4ZI26_9HYPH|nr:hypothetical protein [Methylobacterium hispanicum]GJD87842.1 hypothetical protein BHAOGJBA_1347 [Methylobacterium hispanicum]
MPSQNIDRGDQPFRPAIAPRDLIPNLDVHGNALEIGCRVRSFSSTFAYEDGRVAGLETAGDRVSYLEGVLRAIGDVRRDCPRYTIEVERRVSGRGDRIKDETVAADDPWRTVIPPVNGTPTSAGEYCFGVVRIADAPAPEREGDARTTSDA